MIDVNPFKPQGRREAAGVDFANGKGDTQWITIWKYITKASPLGR